MKNSRGLMCNGVKIIYQCSDFVVAEKPHNLPTAPLKEGENNTALEEVLRQFEAGRSLGFNYVQTMRFIVIPQTIKNVLPSLANEFIALF